MRELAPRLAPASRVLALALAGAACCACSRRADGGPPTDAKTNAGFASNADASSAAGPAGAPAYAGPFEAHVVAHMIGSRAALVPLADGDVVLRAGFFRYALHADGTATRIGELSAYAAKMPSEDTQLGGYDVEPVAPDETVPGARPWHDLRGPLDGRRTPEGWALSDDIDVPADLEGEDLRRAADGTTVVLARAPNSETYVTFVAPPGSRHVTRTPIDGIDPARRNVACDHVPSWGRPHLLCRSWRDGLSTVHRLAGERWELVRLPLADEDVKHLRVAAVGPDGALWLGLSGGKVLRIAANGASETFDLPKPDAALARPSYASSETYGRPAIAGSAGSEGSAGKATPSDTLFGEGGLRRWERVGIAIGAPPGAIAHIRQIVPRADGEAWVLAAESRGATVLVHMSRPAIAPLPTPLVVGTETDQRNELRNLKEPLVWVAHCPQLFVTLAKERADGSMAATSVWSHQPEIAAIVKRVVGKTRSDAPISMIIEGRLAARRVAGVLVWRADPSASEDLLEKTTSALATELSPMTGATPRITCTAPVLERVSAPLR